MRDNSYMEQLFLMAIAAGILAVLSSQQANAQYGDNQPLALSGSAVSEDMLQRCPELGISRVQCNEVSILQAERKELVARSEEKGSGTSMIATGLDHMAAFFGFLGAVFGGIAGAFYFMSRRARPLPS